MNNEHSRPGARMIGYALPETGDGLISMGQFAQVLSVVEATAWAWAKSDPNWPPIIRRGARFSRMRIVDCRTYLAALTASATPKRAKA